MLKEYKKLLRKAKRESWIKFCEQTESTSEMAQIGKIIRYHPKFSLGFLRDSQGRMSSSPEETLDILSRNSFPGCSDFICEREPRNDLFEQLKAEWRSKEMIKRAFADFSPHKSGGPDQLKPIALQSLPDSFVERLSNIYDASLTSGYTPNIWRNSRVIYIPKPGKDSYEEAKSFRPITLTSFLFKGLEKLVYWHVENTTLKTKPYDDNQHAFRSGKSTESALSQIVNEIEKGVLRRGYTLAVFTDIAGAFDNLSFDAASKAMKSKKISGEIQRWYEQYLQNRTSVMELKGIAKKIAIKTGCPQGGV